MALIVCPKCGASMSENASVCPQCGLPIKESPAPQPAKRSRKWIVWVIIACVVVAGGLVAASFLFAPSAEKCYEKGMTKTSEDLPKMIFSELLGKSFGDGMTAIMMNTTSHIFFRPGEEELAWFKKGGEKGDGRCNLMAGCMYYYGYGTERNRKMASLYFRLAGEQNVPMGKLLYAMMLMVDPETRYYPEEGDKHYVGGLMIREAANENCPEACYFIAAVMIESGNISEGATYLKRATDQGVEDVLKLHVLTAPRNTPPPINYGGMTW